MFQADVVVVLEIILTIEVGLIIVLKFISVSFLLMTTADVRIVLVFFAVVGCCFCWSFVVVVVCLFVFIVVVVCLFVFHMTEVSVPIVYSADCILS